jgi:hypothetical protein
MLSYISRLPSLVRKLKLSDYIFLGNFGLAKVFAYAAPLVIASIVSPDLYGAVELSLAMGLQIASFTIGSQLAGIIQAFLVRNEQRVIDTLFSVSATAIAISLLFFGGLLLMGASETSLLVAAAFGFAIVQNAGSTWLRMTGARNLTAWVDGAGLLLSGSIVLLAVGLSKSDQFSDVVWLSATLSACTMVGCVIGVAFNLKPDFVKRLISFTKLGFPIMIAGTIGIWIGVGGRIMVGGTNPADLAVYSLAFRISGLTLGIHQLAMTAGFAVLYSARTKRADFLLSNYLKLVLLLSILISLFGPLIVQTFDFSALDNEATVVFAQLIPVCGLHTFLWIGFAMLQLRLNRVGLAQAFIVPLSAITAIGAGTIYLASQYLDLGVVGVVWLLTGQGGIYFAAAWISLAKRGLPHRKVGLVAGFGTVVLVLVAIASQILK